MSKNDKRADEIIEETMRELYGDLHKSEIRDSIDEDDLSTLTFTKGVKEGLKFVENLDNVDAIFITNDKKIYLTENIKDNFKLMSNDFEISN